MYDLQQYPNLSNHEQTLKVLNSDNSFSVSIENKSA